MLGPGQSRGAQQRPSWRVRTGEEGPMRQFLLQWLAESVSILLAIILRSGRRPRQRSYPLAGLYEALGWTNYHRLSAWSTSSSPSHPGLHLRAAGQVRQAGPDRPHRPAHPHLHGLLAAGAERRRVLALHEPLTLAVLLQTEARLLWTMIAALLFTVIETVLRIAVGVDQPKPVSEQENDRYWKLVERFSGGRREHDRREPPPQAGQRHPARLRGDHRPQAGSAS